jgi:single-strand DNA-binding protein
MRPLENRLRPPNLSDFMANYNKVFLMGNLTRDPELRYTPKGTAVAKLGLAVNRSWRSESGETREETTFVDVDAFGRQAETIAQYLKKGKPIFIEGRLRLDTWDDKQTNQKRSKLGVILEAFQFIDSKGGERTSPAPNASPSRSPESPSVPSSSDSPGEFPPEEDDVPF